MSGAPEVITLLAALGCGVMAGVWFAFSAFVMSALDRLPGSQGMAAMQSINVRALTPPLMTALFGTGLACLGLMVWALPSFDEPGAGWVLGGGALYLMGSIGVTMAANVPLNNRLASEGPQSTVGPERWSAYVGRWTAWNHVRCVTAVGAAALLVVALLAD